MNTRAQPAPGLLSRATFSLLQRNEISGTSSETPAWLKVKPYSFWPVHSDPSPDPAGTDFLQSNAVCAFSVHFGVRFLEPEYNYCTKDSRDFCSHLPLICHFHSPKGLKGGKVLSLKKLEMADPPKRTNLGKKNTRLSLFLEQRIQSRKLAACVHREEDIQCMGARECSISLPEQNQLMFEA